MASPPASDIRSCVFPFRTFSAALCCLTWAAAASGQTSELSAKEQAFAQTEETIAADITELRARYKNATAEAARDALKQWYDQNADVLAAQRNVAKEIESLHEPVSVPILPLVIPNDVTSGVAEIWQNQRSIDQELKELQFAYTDTPPEQRRAAMQQWHEQNAARITEQDSLLSALPAQPYFEEQPITLEIPAEASPDLKTLLFLQASIDEGILAIQQDYKNAAPEELRDALWNWSIKNSEQLDAIDGLQLKSTAERRE